MRATNRRSFWTAPVLWRFALGSLIVWLGGDSLIAADSETTTRPLSVKLPGWISSVAFSPNGQQVAASCSDNTARLLNAKTGEEISVLKGHRDYVVAVAFSPDGRTLATGSYDNKLRLWDLPAR